MSIIIFVVSVAVLVGLDQWIKVLAIQHLKGTAGIPIIEGIFELQYTENPGAAFGMLAGKQWFFILITIFIVAVILYYYFKVLKDPRFNWLKFTLILITSGAIGNFIDRTFRPGNKVIDYLYFKLIDFPIFNLADCFVVVGTALFALLLFTKYKQDFLDS